MIIENIFINRFFQKNFLNNKISFYKYFKKLENVLAILKKRIYLGPSFYIIYKYFPKLLLYIYIIL